ncbi:uncharacterized protein LOC132639403 [Lycium barbarum]|uniref:uncharacterized protein LOC132639403 n=1 Tax=Lycium barbarum TaxID=112863 RepID=UPI00293E054A|nr:uncharacterized protein LOC132639403 [Lycium barbarum]
MGDTTENVTTQTRNPTAVDSTHAYYLHPSDAPGMVLVSSPFDGKGFGGWKRTMLIALSTKNKTGFIYGTLTKPLAGAPLLNAWTRFNDIVLSWLLNSLSKEIAESVVYYQSAQLLWSDLESRFGQTNSAKLFQLEKELSGLVQGNLTVIAYFTKLKCIWDELDAMKTFSMCTCDCNCGSREKNDKAQDDERLLQFLIGLNDSYLGQRRNILMNTLLPFVSHVYSLAKQDEKQAEIHHSSPNPIESSSFVAAGQSSNRRSNYQGNRTNSDNRRNYTGHGNTCSYCKKVGHTTDKCFKLHGFPSDFKFYRAETASPKWT